MLARARTGAIVDNADRSVEKALGILSVTPGNARRGQTHTLRFDLDPSVRGGLPEGDPTWVQIGPFEATKVHREGNTISAEIALSNDAPLGVLLDAHIEFGKPDEAASRPVRVLKKSDAFRIIP